MLVLAGTVFDGGDIALFIALAAGALLVVLGILFMLGWLGVRALKRR